MTECQHCKGESDMPFQCHYCKAIFCSDHRLPEAHECDGVRFLTDPGKRFESLFTDEVVHTDEEIRKPEPIEPEYTVGNTPKPDYDKPPDVETNTEKIDPEGDSKRSGLITKLRKIVGL